MAQRTRSATAERVKHLREQIDHWRSTRVKLWPMDEEDHEANRAERAQGVDAEEVACVQRLPVASEELSPGPPSTAFRRWPDASLRQDARDRGAADFDLEPAQGVADLRVASAGVLAGEPDDQVADIVRFARPAAHPALVGAVVPLCGELPKPRQDGLWTHDLATVPTLFGGESLAPDRQPSSLVGRERQPGPAGLSSEALLEDADLLLQVLDPARHLFVDRVREDRDDEQYEVAMRTKGRATTAALATALALALPAAARGGEKRAGGEKGGVKAAARDVGHGVGEAARTVGHTARDGAKAVGHGARDAARAVGHGFRDTAKEVGHGVRDAVKD